MYEAAGAEKTPDAAGCLMSIGAVHSEQGDNPRALDYYKRALQVYEAAGAEKTPDANACRNLIARAEKKRGKRRK